MFGQIENSSFKTKLQVEKQFLLYLLQSPVGVQMFRKIHYFKIG